MTIETKYNIGDEVWAILGHNGATGCVQCRVIKIEIKVTNFRPFITYGLAAKTTQIMDDCCYDYPIPEKYHEDYIFPTKEELLKSL